MAERTCGWCGESIDHMRAIAKFCCLQHKKNAGAKRFRDRNPGYYKRYHSSPARIAWREANQERLRLYAREYQANLSDRAERNRKAMKFNNPDSVGVSERDWIKLCRRYRDCCAYCDRKPDRSLEMDHVIPLTKGGRHAIGNILPACHDCNLSKNAALHIVWKYRKAYRLAGEMYGGDDSWPQESIPAQEWARPRS